MRARKIKILIIISILTIIAGAVWVDRLLAPIEFEPSFLTIQSGTRMWPIEVEIASSKKQREQGLMFRRRVPEGTGMLFTFDEPQVVSMWMKNTLVSLDMLFIDSKGHIVFIAKKLRPRSQKIITFDQPVSAVLELRGGTADHYMLKAGDFLIHPFFERDRRRH